MCPVSYPHIVPIGPSPRLTSLSVHQRPLIQGRDARRLLHGLATWPKLQGYGLVPVTFLTDRGVSERTGTARYVTRSVVRPSV